MGVDWRDTKSLGNLSPGEALVVLGQITEALKHPKEATETMDAAEDRRFAAIIDSSPEAIQFADACNAMGRRMRAAGDCRPELRIRSEERREVLDAQPKTAEEDAASYAASLRPFHRR